MKKLQKLNQAVQKSVSRYEVDFKDFQIKRKMRSQMPNEHKKEFDKDLITSMSIFCEQKHDNFDVVLVVVSFKRF